MAACVFIGSLTAGTFTFFSNPKFEGERREGGTDLIPSTHLIYIYDGLLMMGIVTPETC
jgi:hypothetical protein